MPNANFLFTIEYLLNRNGIIGLHGYTHQYGNEISGDGTEFSEERNKDESTIRKRIEAAINISKNLELPVKFFESPHYPSTEFQQSIFEQYFDVIYEGFVGIWGEKVVTSPRNHMTLYVPTPLSYIEGPNGLRNMIDRINNLDKNALASLFYHPKLDFDYITLSEDASGYPLNNYSNNSPLHKIVRTLESKGYSFGMVKNLGCKNEKNILNRLSCIFSDLYRYLKYTIKI